MSSEGTPVSVSRQLLLSIKKPHRFTSRYGRNDSETKAKFCSVKPTPPMVNILTTGFYCSYSNLPLFLGIVLWLDGKLLAVSE